MARLVGLLIIAVMTVIGGTVVLNVNGIAHALVEQQRRHSYARLFPLATSEVALRVWAGIVALVGGALLVVVLYAVATGR